MKRLLTESLSFDQARLKVESEMVDPSDSTKGKNLYMKGVFIQGDVKNLNERVYPLLEIRKAVNRVQETIARGFDVIGELDHPAELTVSLSRASHVITEMNMEGSNGVGKLKIIGTPSGQIAQTLIESGIKLGVSSRGTGDVDRRGFVQGFDMITVDIVATPSAPGAYPVAVYEALNSNRRGAIMEDLATSVKHDKVAQDYLQRELMAWLSSLK